MNAACRLIASSIAEQPPCPISGWCFGGVAENRDTALDPGVERVEVEDLDAIGGGGIEGGDEFAHAGRPVRELLGENSSRVVPSLSYGTPLRQDVHVAEEAEAIAGHRHHRHPAVVTHVSGLFGGGADLLADGDQAVEVHVPGIAPGDRTAQNIFAGMELAPSAPIMKSPVVVDPSAKATVTP